MMGKRLQTVDDHVTDITISTATVDIQVMRIGTKQMTLAVFRQLPMKDIFDEWGDLLAPPWGWVNYDRNDGNAKPFVFSYEGILYRDPIDIPRQDILSVAAETKEQIIPAHHSESNTSIYTSWVPEKTVWAPTGKWMLTTRPDSNWNYLGLLFESEASARVHLANRRAGIARLKEAPQLFIGV